MILLSNEKEPTSSQIERLSEYLKIEPQLIRILINSRTFASKLIGFYRKIFLLRVLSQQFQKDGFDYKVFQQTIRNDIKQNSNEWNDAVKWLKSKS